MAALEPHLFIYLGVNNDVEHYKYLTPGIHQTRVLYLQIVNIQNICIYKHRLPSGCYYNLIDLALPLHYCADVLTEFDLQSADTCTKPF